MHPETDGPTRVTLSTGHEITLPLDLEFAVGGVTVPARRERLEALLPAGLSALAIGPGVGCVTFVGIQYHRVGGDGRASTDSDAGTGLEPYDEFGIIVPAVRGSRTTLPFAQVVDGEVGGYVHWLPVTTDASVALGREIWGYPKERAVITVTDGPRGLRAVVGDGETGTSTVRLEVPRPRTRVATRERDWAMWSYTTLDGDLLRSQARIRGEIAAGSPVGTSIEIGSELQATLGCWNRPLGRLYGARARARLHAGDPVGAL